VKPLRVYIYPAGLAGMAFYSYKLANALAGRGLQVKLFVDDQYELEDMPAKFDKVNVLSSKNVTFGSNRNRVARMANVVGAHVYNWHKFYFYVKNYRPDVVHIQPLFHLVDWYILGFLRAPKRKLVITVHDVIPHKFYSRRFHRLELVILQYIYNKADKLIVHSQKNKEQLLEHFSVDEHKVIVVPHGEYTLPETTQVISASVARSTLNLNEHQQVILYFGFIRKNKGIDILLKAFDRVAETVPNSVLVVAGSAIQGESFHEYRQIINRMKHKSRVRCFVKYVETKDLPTYFTPAEIVVLPYVEFCSQSGVLHLAQGFGKAVICTNVGGMPEVVENHKTGLIVPPGSVERLAEAMIYVLEHKEVREQMGQRAKETALKRFSWDEIAKATIEKAYT
jgi:glycosyltransferase involved in cell wall biosynthesis